MCGHMSLLAHVNAYTCWGFVNCAVGAGMIWSKLTLMRFASHRVKSHFSL